MTRRLGNDGYNFAKVTGITEVNEEDNTVAMKFFVDPGKRTYVRRIDFKGNMKTSAWALDNWRENYPAAR
jgi:outer membrane protein insertion porin family